METNKAFVYKVPIGDYNYLQCKTLRYKTKKVLVLNRKYVHRQKMLMNETKGCRQAILTMYPRNRRCKIFH